MKKNIQVVKKKRNRTQKKRITKKQIMQKESKKKQKQFNEQDQDYSGFNDQSSEEETIRDDRSDITLENNQILQPQNILEEYDKLDEKTIKQKSILLDKIQKQKKKKIQQQQKRRLQMFLKKDNKKNQSQIKNKNIQNQKQNESTIETKQQQNINQQNQDQNSIFVKSQHVQQNSIQSRPQQKQKQDPQLLQYLFKIMNGTISKQQIDKKRQQQQKKIKLQQKIKQLYKQKIQQKIKKQDTRSQSEYNMKLLSTNHDSFCGKSQNFNLPEKSQLGDKLQANSIISNQPIRKKRANVTAQMLRLIIKQFQFMNQQRSGFYPNIPKIKFQDIGKKYKLGRSSVIKLFAQYCQDPTMKKRFQSKQPSTKSRTMLQLTKRRINFVQKLIKKNCTLSQRQIAAEMNQHDDLKLKRKKLPEQSWQQYMKNPYHPVAYKAVSRLMKLANLTRKKVTLIPLNRNSQRTIEQRYNFCKILNKLVGNSNNKLYFLDQCRFNLFTSRDFGWAPRGELATKVRHNSKGKDIMLLAIIGKQGLIGYELSDSYNRGSFTIAVNKLINNIIPKQMPENQKIFLILDNCPIHNKDNLKHLQQTLPLTILYLPPYTPMLNPIQSWFNQLKCVVKSKIYKTRGAMKTSIIQTLQTFKNKSMESYYKNIQASIALGLQKELFR